MLDVFVVSLLAGLVHIQGLADISAGLGIAAFAGVVVLTMLASISFDPRLTWDDAPVADNWPPINRNPRTRPGTTA
jgi:paraquat-inducible protein A